MSVNHGLYQRRMRAKWRAAGICTRCGKKPIAPGSVAICEECGTTARNRARAKSKTGETRKVKIGSDNGAS